VNCGSIVNESNSKWNETIANGQSVNGECLKGFNGTISRSCLQNDTIGNWDSISGYPFSYLISYYSEILKINFFL